MVVSFRFKIRWNCTVYKKVFPANKSFFLIGSSRFVVDFLLNSFLRCNWFLYEIKIWTSRLIDVYFIGSKHEPDGRAILAEFESFRLLNTYVPNNGWKEEESSFQRRRKWDKRVLEFVHRTSDKPLIWCGDLNVRYLSFNNSSLI